MPEFRDVYNAHGERTGRAIPKGERLAPGEYYLHVIILVMGRGGRYLLQQRSLKARYFPGEWDVTGGGVISGESSREAAVREAFEELGLTLNPEALVYGGRIEQNGDCWMDMYGAKLDITEADCRIQPMEVNAVRMEEYAEFERIVSYNKSEAFIALQRRTHAMLEGI